MSDAQEIFPPVEDVESQIARDLARRAALVTPLVALVIGLWRGPDAALAVVFALGLLVGNFLLSAWILGYVARQNPSLLMGVTLFSFVFRLILITVIGLGIKELDLVDWPVFCITLIIGYFVLLVWEMRSVSFSLASPGLKPKPKEIWE
ncbi:hypothetical protein LBMAG14_00630 [Actinomycetes bacterium]|jgi:hypothetical protein|nr:hypothetical protein LBMAG14_00630 [Actinomycetes bacterium]